jgi:hypothetical protein
MSESSSSYIEPANIRPPTIRPPTIKLTTITPPTIKIKKSDRNTVTIRYYDHITFIPDDEHIDPSQPINTSTGRNVCAKVTGIYGDTFTLKVIGLNGILLKDSIYSNIYRNRTNKIYSTALTDNELNSIENYQGAGCTNPQSIRPEYRRVLPRVLRQRRITEKREERKRRASIERRRHATMARPNRESVIRARYARRTARARRASASRASPEEIHR